MPRGTKTNRFANAGKALVNASEQKSQEEKETAAVVSGTVKAAEKKQEAFSEYRHIPAEKIKQSPFNEGMPAEEKSIEEYAESMKVSGIIQPVSVYDCGDGTYELISGHQRMAAWCGTLGNKTIPAVVREMEPDIRKRFAAHTEANTKSRTLDGRFWCSRIVQARKVIEAAGGAASKADEVAQITQMLGIAQAQYYRYEQFGQLSRGLQECEALGYVSVRKALLAKNLTNEQQESAAAKIKAAAAERAADTDKNAEITEQEFNEILDSVKTKKQKRSGKPRRLSYAEKTAQAGDAFLKMISKSKTSQEKQAALTAIEDLRKKLDEAEKKIRA